jgi:NAD(P)-dependent dehydrogenase (short-subunit alcohol dehydrogenase family)
MAYSVSKAAGLQLMKNLAFTQGPKIRVNAVLPGLMLTDWVGFSLFSPRFSRRFFLLP